MPAGHARTPRCSPPEHSEPCRESSVGKNLVGPSSPSGPGSWTTWTETSFRAPLWPDWPDWVTWELLPGWASASPQLLGSVVGRRRGTNLATLSLYCRHPWPCAVTASENWIVGTQAEPGGRAGGGTQSVAASWGETSQDTVGTRQRSGVLERQWSPAQRTCPSVTCPRPLSVPFALVTYIAILFHSKLGIGHIKNTKVIIVSRFYHKTN